ncbi:phage infection protein, partial [Lacticaseibacillus suibinensis]|uniref:phage infection protein n=1 Tax=Lacticaseibacillus suibinensis TaxID=2486011 RepID=UPI001941B69D
GRQWQTPFDTTNAVEVAPGDLDTIVMGATKLINGKLVVDEAKQAELEQPVTPQPTTDQKMLAAVMLRVAKLEAGA